jgi:hypothetical protein
MKAVDIEVYEPELKMGVAPTYTQKLMDDMERLPYPWSFVLHDFLARLADKRPEDGEVYAFMLDGKRWAILFRYGTGWIGNVVMPRPNTDTQKLWQLMQGGE